VIQERSLPVLARRCPICGGRFLRFRRTNATTRDRGICGRCGSRQRHRLLWLYLERRTDLLASSARVLHFAPEAGVEQRLRALPSLSYRTADLEPGRAELTLDLTAIDLPDNSVDVVICVHVLEHVEDDRQALRELYRILAPGGWGILQVPIFGDTTQEDPTVRTPEERLRRFGQEDHVRVYGRDFRDRLIDAGFELEVTVYRDQLSPRELVRFGLLYDYRREFGVDFNQLTEPWEIWKVRKPGA
jgi:SAM-dependent methyltransferase